MLNLLVVSVIAYAATNVDNLTVLLAFLAASRGHTRVVIVGHIGGSLALIAFALGCAVLMLSLPRSNIGLLGFVPLCIGLFKLFRRWFGNDDANAMTSESNDKVPISGWMVGMVAISNGSDNIAVYASLYAGRPASSVAVITVTLIAMIGVMCLVANCLVSHPFIGLRIKHYGEVVLPWVLIAIGISVLQQSGTLQYVGL